MGERIPEKTGGFNPENFHPQERAAARIINEAAAGKVEERDDELPPVEAGGGADEFRPGGGALDEVVEDPFAARGARDPELPPPRAEGLGAGRGAEALPPGGEVVEDPFAADPGPAGGAAAMEPVIRGYEGDYISTERPDEEGKGNKTERPEPTIVAVPPKADDNDGDTNSNSLNSTRPAPSAPTANDGSIHLNPGGEPRLIRVDRGGDADGGAAGPVPAAVAEGIVDIPGVAAMPDGAPGVAARAGGRLGRAAARAASAAERAARAVTGVAIAAAGAARRGAIGLVDRIRGR